MDWFNWLMLILGLVCGGSLGFVIGRYAVPAPPPTRALEKEDAAEREADAEREKIEDDLAAKIDETEKADAEKLKELLDADFSGSPGVRAGAVEPTGKSGK